VIGHLRDSVKQEVSECSCSEGIGNVRNTNATVWIVKLPSPAKSIVIELYGSYYRISNCDTVDGSNCKIVNGVSVRASGINSLYAIRREVTCRVIHPTRDNLFSN
jgi:hypothetical protein